jgi:hypothetical protein
VRREEGEVRRERGEARREEGPAEPKFLTVAEYTCVRLDIYMYINLSVRHMQAIATTS